eukprot:s196_g23.t1
MPLKPIQYVSPRLTIPLDLARSMYSPPAPAAAPALRHPDDPSSDVSGGSQAHASVIAANPWLTPVRTSPIQDASSSTRPHAPAVSSDVSRSSSAFAEPPTEQSRVRALQQVTPQDDLRFGGTFGNAFGGTLQLQNQETTLQMPKLALQSWELVEDNGDQSATGPTPREASIPETQIPFGDYDSWAEQIPAVPGYYLRLGKRLVAGEYTVDYRIKRAWEAGFWASLVLGNKISKPRASLPLNIRPCIYIILKAPGLESPTRVSSASDLHRITGRFTEDTLCHGFPSLAEAEAYCGGAGVELPCQHQWK